MKKNIQKKRITGRTNKIFIVYLSVLLYLLFLSSFRISNMNGITSFSRVNLTPFLTIKNYIINYHYFRFSDVIINLVGNIVVFVPLGFLLPQINKKVNTFIRLLVIVVLFTLCVEICQTLLGVGIGDVDDVILNSVGGIIGYYFYCFFKKNKKKFAY